MTAPAISAPAKGRLGNGQLRRQVAEWLAARLGPHTPGEIAKDLGRSAGAVGNALTTLADRGEADRLPGSAGGGLRAALWRPDAAHVSIPARVMAEKPDGIAEGGFGFCESVSPASGGGGVVGVGRDAI